MRSGRTRVTAIARKQEYPARITNPKTLAARNAVAPTAPQVRGAVAVPACIERAVSDTPAAHRLRRKPGNVDGEEMWDVPIFRCRAADTAALSVVDFRDEHGPVETVQAYLHPLAVRCGCIGLP